MNMTNCAMCTLAGSSESTQTVTNSRQEVQCLGDGVVWPSCTPSSLPSSGSSEALSFASISASSPTVSAGAAEGMYHVPASLVSICMYVQCTCIN